MSSKPTQQEGGINITNDGRFTIEGSIAGRDIIVNYFGLHNPTEEMIADYQAAERHYRQQLIKIYQGLKLIGFPERERGLSEIPLERIFVRLKTKIEHRHRDDHEQSRRDLKALLLSHDETEQVQREVMQAFEEEVVAMQPKVETLTIAETLDRYRRVVIIGAPGSGKTTLMRWLALTFARNRQAQSDRLGDQFDTPRLPILLELRRFADAFRRHSDEPHTPNFAKIIGATIAKDGYFVGITAAFIEAQLRAGRCLLLVDGLDEIADLRARRELVSALDALLARSDGQYRDNLCVVTSRPHGYREMGLGQRFQQCEVEPFTCEEVGDFITHWYREAYGVDGSADAAALNAQIADHERVAELASNPLLCTIVAIVYRNNRVLPNRRVVLYHKCCEALLDTWERSKAIRESGLIGQYDWETKLSLLAPLAYWLHEERERVAAPEAALVAQLTTILLAKGLAHSAETAREEARRFIMAIRDRSGILQGRGDGSLEFAHRTFQEYLAARYIAAQPDPAYIDLVMPHLHDAWWREVHLLTIGELGSRQATAEKASRLIFTIIHAHKPPLWFLRYESLHSLFLSSAPFGLLRMQESLGKFSKLTLVIVAVLTVVWLIPQLLFMQFASLFPRWQWARRITWLTQRDFQFAVEGFLDCTTLGTTEVMRNDIRRTAEQLLYQLVYDPVRYNDRLIELVITVIHEQTSTALIEALKMSLTFPIWSVRRAAANSLRLLKEADELITATLFDALQDENRNVRIEVIQVLSTLRGQEKAISAVLAGMLYDEDNRVRETVVQSLKSLEYADEVVVSALLNAALRDEDSFVRFRSAITLRELKLENDTVIVYLTEALSDVDAKVRSAAVYGLGLQRDGNERTIAALLNALQDECEDVREQAARSLTRLEKKDEVVIAILSDSLNDESGKVRIAVAESLSKLGEASETVDTVLLTALHAQDSEVRSEAAKSFGRLQKKEQTVIVALLSSLDDKNEDVRAAAADSLGQLGEGNRAVSTALLKMLHDTHRSRKNCKKEKIEIT